MSKIQRLIELEGVAQEFGFEWPDQFMILDQIIDECREVKETIEQPSTKDRLQEEIGDLLHAVISLCLFSGFDVEESIEKVNIKFSRRIKLLKEITKSHGLESLQGQSIEYLLNIWKEVKHIEIQQHDEQKFEIRSFIASDIATMVKAFHAIGWNKPRHLFERYLQEEQAGERLIWLAFVREAFAGYVTLKWESLYQPFREHRIPEIMDLNVLPSYRKLGIGSHLLRVAEQEATTGSDVVGIGVGLYAGEDGGYGTAQRLYVKRGYVPDGKGMTYRYQHTVPGSRYQLDDELLLWFTKKLR